MQKYNILIPHKNNVKCLQRCLDSIPQRDDVKIIVVDDNSSPDVVDFNYFPGKNRKDVEVIFDKVGGGAGHARNIAMRHAVAEKIINADCDDFFTYCFNDVLDEYSEDDSDIVFLNVCSVMENTYLHSDRCIYKNKLIDGYLHDDSVKYELLLRYDEGSPCSKIIKKSLIDEHQILFEEVPIHDDVKFSYMIGHYAGKVKVDERAIYCITQSPTSISFSLTDEKYLTRMNVIGERDRFVLQQGLKLDCTGRFLTQTLLEIRDAGKTDLYEHCLHILECYGFTTEIMRMRVTDSVKRRKSKEKRSRCKAIIKDVLKKCHIL